MQRSCLAAIPTLSRTPLLLSLPPTLGPFFSHLRPLHTRISRKLYPSSHPFCSHSPLPRASSPLLTSTRASIQLKTSSPLLSSLRSPCSLSSSHAFSSLRPPTRSLHTPARPSIPLRPFPSTHLLVRSSFLLSHHTYDPRLPPHHNSNNAIRSFHASRPLLAGVHAFRLAHFVAPIVMRQVKSWIGTPSTNANFKRNLFVVLAVILGIPILYIGTHLETTPYTDRLRFVALTSDDEIKLGELTFNQLVEEHETNFIPDHHHFVAHVTEVANRIIAATERKDIQWEIRLIDSPITNAFAIPGGKIVVFSGLLDVTLNDDGLAFILGHEVAHVIARHGAEQMAVGKVMLGVSVLVSALFGDNIGSFILGRLLSWLTELSYSRSMEREADYIGLLLMHNAKYNINEAPKVWERMVMANPEEGSPYLSTHPSHSERVADIRKWVADIKKSDEEARLLPPHPPPLPSSSSSSQPSK